MSNMVMTFKEVIQAHEALTKVAGYGYKNQKIAKKVAKLMIWTTKKMEEYEEQRKILIKGHAVLDENGNIVPEMQRDENTGELSPVPNTVRIENHQEFQQEIEQLLNTEINTNGILILESELETCKVDLEPKIYVGLGPFLKWEDDEQKG